MTTRKMLLLPALVFIVQVYLAAANCKDCNIPIPELTLTIGGHLNTCPYCEHVKQLQAAPNPPPSPLTNPPLPDSHNLPSPSTPVFHPNPTYLPSPVPLPPHLPLPVPLPPHLPLPVPLPPHLPNIPIPSNLPVPFHVPAPVSPHLPPLPSHLEVLSSSQPVPTSVLPYLKQLILTDPNLKENNLDLLLLLLLSESSVLGTNCPPGCQCTCNSVCPYCNK
ncbi:hypothetical protein ACJJTC_012570 [Scirpophaga incertulas]